MSTFWSLWDNGLNWVTFLICFLLIEWIGGAHSHRTLSQTFWAGLNGSLGEWLLPLAWIALSLILFAHLVGYWPGRG